MQTTSTLAREAFESSGKKETEIWKPVTGYEGLYSISSIGRVKSVGRTITYKTGKKKKIHEKILKMYNKSHYYSITLCKNNTKLTKNIHRMVAEEFLDNIDNLPVVNHIDGDKKNNHVSNLEWCTFGENEFHSIHTLGKIPQIQNLKGIKKPKKIMLINDKYCFGEYLQNLAFDLYNGKEIKTSDDGYGHVPSQVQALRKRFGLKISYYFYNWRYKVFYFDKDYIKELKRAGQIEFVKRIQDLDVATRNAYKLV